MFFSLFVFQPLYADKLENKGVEFTAIENKTNDLR